MLIRSVPTAALLCLMHAVLATGPCAQCFAPHPPPSPRHGLVCCPWGSAAQAGRCLIGLSPAGSFARWVAGVLRPRPGGLRPGPRNRSQAHPWVLSFRDPHRCTPDPAEGGEGPSECLHPGGLPSVGAAPPPQQGHPGARGRQLEHASRKDTGIQALDMQSPSKHQHRGRC